MTETEYQGISVKKDMYLAINKNGCQRQGDAFKIIFVDKGELRVTVDGIKYKVESNKAILIVPKDVYKIEAMSEEASTISIEISKAEIWQSETNNFLLKNIGCLANKSFELKRVYENTEIKNTLKECLEEWENQTGGFKLIIKMNIEKILIWVIRDNISKIYSNSCKSMGNEYIEKAITYMEQNLKDISAADMAEHIGISYTYFLKIFKDVTGCNFVKFAHNMRIQKAQTYLLKTNKNLDKIAKEVGFSTTSHFIKVFKSHTGITPSAYRRQVLYGKSNLKKIKLK